MIQEEIIFLWVLWVEKMTLTSSDTFASMNVICNRLSIGAWNRLAIDTYISYRT